MAKKPTYGELQQRGKELQEEVDECTQALEVLQESEARFRTLADFAHDWTYWIAPDGAYLYISPSCERITGYRPNDFKEDPGLLEAITHPNDRTLIRKHLRDELRSKDVRSFDFRLITRDGQEKWIGHICQQVYGTDGNLLGRRASNRDVTGRKQAEQAMQEGEARYKAVFEHTKNGIAVYREVNGGEDFVFVDLNKSGEKIDKVKRTEIVGKSVLDVFPEVKGFGLFEVFQRVWATGKAEHFPVSFYRDERIVGWRDNFVYKLPTGEIVAVYSDETERKQAEEALQKAHQELYKLSQELEKKVKERARQLENKSKQLIEAERLAVLGTMANRVAHELRNPLTVVGGFARRMDEKMAETDPNKKYMGIILGEIVLLENKVSEIIKLRDEA